MKENKDMKAKVHRIRDIRYGDSRVTLKGKISDFAFVKGKHGGRLTATFSDGTGVVDLIWSKGIKWVRESLKEGEEIVLHGNPCIFAFSIQIADPELEKLKRKKSKK